MAVLRNTLTGEGAMVEGDRAADVTDKGRLTEPSDSGAHLSQGALQFRWYCD